jgi:predicted helicase
VYGRLFDQVWLWKDWPGRAGKVDTGIDLVAQEAETGDLWAIQCKFYEPVHTLSKPASTRFCPRL